MEFIIESPDSRHRIDPPLHNILRALSQTGGRHVTVVPITRLDDFKFDLHVKPPWVLFDMTEFGWQWDQQSSYRWGIDRLDHEWFKGDEWRRMDDFVVNNPPLLTFQRELLARDVSDTLLPIEYANWLPEHPLDSREKFNARPLEVLHNGGRSHEGRVMLFGAIFQGASRHGYDVVTRWEDIERAIADNPAARKWANIFCPHFSRIDVREVDAFNNRSKLSISWHGCGKKCFRASESINGSIMVLPEDKLAWSYPYVDCLNCIRVEDFGTSQQGADRAINQIAATLKFPDLHSLYVRAQEQAHRYRAANYARDWIAANIEKRL